MLQNVNQFLSAFRTFHLVDRIFWEHGVAFQDPKIHDATQLECHRSLNGLPGASAYWSIDARTLANGGNILVHAGVHWHGGERESFVQVTHDQRADEWFVTACVLGGITPADLFALAGDLGVERNRAKKISAEEAHERVAMLAEFIKRRL